jgi:hypothetical protein
MAIWTLTINTNTITLGSVTPVSGSTYDDTTPPATHTPTITATAEAGCRFIYWTGDLTGNVNPTTLHMTKNMTVSAWFAVEATESVDLPVPSVVGSFDSITPTESVDLLAPSVVESFFVTNPLDIAGAILKDSPSTYTDYTTQANNDTANDVVLLPATPATPATNDAFFFGVSDIDSDTLRYVINIGTAGVGTWTITYYYWNGVAWTALPTTNVIHKSGQFLDFKTVGLGSLWIIPPVDWATTAVNGSTKYWLEARVTSYTSNTAIPLATRIYQSLVIYSITRNESVSESVTFTESESKIINKSFSEPIFLTDSLSQRAVKPFMDTVFFMESVLQQLTVALSVGERVDFTETILKTLTQPFVESTNFTEEVISKTLTRSFVESTNFIEETSLENAQYRFRDFIYFREIINKTLYKYHLEDTPFAESISKRIIKPFIEIVSFIESILQHRIINRQLHEYLNLFELAPRRGIIHYIQDHLVRLDERIDRVLRSGAKLFFFRTGERFYFDEYINKQIEKYEPEQVEFNEDFSMQLKRIN